MNALIKILLQPKRKKQINKCAISFLLRFEMRLHE